MILRSIPIPIDVWTYHDVAYTLLWVSYVGFVIWELSPWKRGSLTAARVVIALFGFSLLTAGLWLAQDAMNSVLVLGRTYVDAPFFVGRFDLYGTRNAANLLVSLGFIAFYGLLNLADRV